MSVSESDISWPVLRRIVQDWAGAAADLAEVKPLVGGCINTTLALTLADGARAVLKISPHRVNRDYQRESKQLRLLAALGLPVPQVHAVHVGSLENPHSFLLMEHIEGINFAEARRQLTPGEFDQLQENLADVVLAMHAHSEAQYFRAGDDQAPRFDSWPDFYRHVYDPIWREVQNSPLLPPKTRKQIGRVHERLDKLLVHGDLPRLVHWDIWATNLMASRDEQGRWRVAALLDPNCKYAHAEAEIAYTELFRTVTPAFLKAYQRVRKLESGYQNLRRPVYQLYPLVNHVRLFGQPYVRPLLEAVERTTTIV